MATALVNIGFGFGASYVWFLCFWALNGLLQARRCPIVPKAMHLCAHLCCCSLLGNIDCMGDTSGSMWFAEWFARCWSGATHSTLWRRLVGICRLSMLATSLSIRKDMCLPHGNGDRELATIAGLDASGARSTGVRQAADGVVSVQGARDVVGVSVTTMAHALVNCNVGLEAKRALRRQALRDEEWCVVGVHKPHRASKGIFLRRHCFRC